MTVHLSIQSQMLDYLDCAVRKTGEEPFFWYTSLPIVGTLPSTCLAIYNLIRVIDRVVATFLFGIVASFSQKYVPSFQASLQELGEFSTLFVVTLLGMWTFGLVTNTFYIQRLYLYVEKLDKKVDQLEKR
jgi:hypothetical protein